MPDGLRCALFRQAGKMPAKNPDLNDEKCLAPDWPSGTRDPRALQPEKIFSARLIF